MKRVSKQPTPDDIRRKIASATRSAELEIVAREIEQIGDREGLVELFQARMDELDLNVPAELRAYAERIAEYAPQWEDALKMFSLVDSLACLERLGVAGASAQLELLVRRLKQRSREEPLFNFIRGQIFSDVPVWWKSVKPD